MSDGTQLQRGLFEGFESHQTPTADDYADVLRHGCVVMDANVLLNLYRYNPQARIDLLNVLRALGGRLFLPHQAVAEFWRNREAAMGDPEATATRAREQLSKSKDQAMTALRTWAARVALSDERLSELLDEVEGAFETVSDAVAQQTTENAHDRVHDTNRDALLRELADAVKGSVGEPLPPGEMDQIVAQGRERVAKSVPPGYMDAAKGDDLALGDFLLWEQVLREASDRRNDVLLVTADVKEDWWRKEHGQTRGPRHELVTEFQERTGGRLFMTQPKRLLELAEDVLQVSVTEETLEDVERVDRLLTEQGTWNREACLELFRLLRVEGFGDRTHVITWAAENDGFVDREAVYEICGYPPSRQLKSFTRPIKRITDDLKARGLLPPSAPHLLETVYDAEFSYVQASGFRLHPDVVGVLAELEDADSDED